MHAFPQAPQWDELVFVLVSHPSAALALQSPKPVAHIPTEHAPAEQLAVLLGTLHGEQDAPPQPVAGSLEETQLVPHNFAPGPHTHAPALHTRPEAHALPQAPQ